MFFLVILSGVEGFAQKADSIHFRKNAIYFGGLGNTGTKYSLNYERKFFEHENGIFAAQLGFGFPYAGGFASCALVSHIFSKSKNHFEIGVGIRLVADNHYFIGEHEVNAFGLDREETVPTANFMYRYEKPDGKFLFRIGWTPLFYNSSDFGLRVFVLFIGANVGYVF